MPEYFVNLTTGSNTYNGLTSETGKGTMAAGVALCAASGDTLNIEGTTRTELLTVSGKTITIRQTPPQGVAGPGVLIPARLPWVIRGDTLLAKSGWTASGNAWKQTFAALIGKSLSSMVYDWDNCTNSDGSKYGHLISAPVADITGAADAIGRYNLNFVTGEVYVFIPGSKIATTSDNPNTSGKDLAYCDTEGKNAITVSTCPNSTIRGYTVYLFPTYTSQDGWGGQATDSPGLTFDAGTILDGGAHPGGSLGQLVRSTGVTVTNHIIKGGRPDATYTIHFQADASLGTIAGTVSSNTFFMYRWKGTDGNVLTYRPGMMLITGITVAAAAVVTTEKAHGLTSGQTVTLAQTNSTPVLDGARVVTVLSPTTFSVPVTTTVLGTVGQILKMPMAANTQIGCYAHGNSGTPIGLITLQSNTFNILEAGPKPWEVAFDAGVSLANRLTKSAYAMRAIGCTVNDAADVTGQNSVWAEGCTWKQTRAIPEGGAGTKGAINLGFDTASNDRFLVYEECAFQLDLSDSGGANPTRGFMVSPGSSTNARIIFINASVYDKATTNNGNFRGFLDNNGEDVIHFELYGSAWQFGTSTSVTALYFGDNSTAAAKHIADNNRYKGIGTGRYSTVAAIDTAAEFLNTSTGVDRTGAAITGIMFPAPTVSLGLDATSDLWAIRRTTNTIVPTSLSVNGVAYTGFYGAFQYDLLISSRPRNRCSLGLYVYLGDGAGNPDTAGVTQHAFDDLTGYLVAGDTYPTVAPYAPDAMIALGMTDLVLSWVYGMVASGDEYSIGNTPSGYPGGAVAVLSQPINQVQHLAAIGSASYLDQIVPAILSRLSGLTSVVLYGGGVAATSGTTAAILDSHSAIVESLGSSAAAAYDSQAVLDYGDAANPHKLHVDRLHARAVNTYNESVDRADVAAIQGWLTIAAGVITTRSRALTVLGNFTGMDSATWHNVRTLRALGLRLRVIVENDSSTAIVRMGRVRNFLAAGCDVDLDPSGFTLGQARRTVQTWKRMTKGPDRRERARGRR